MVGYGDEAAAERCSLRAVISREVQMAVASVSKITAASAEGFDAAVREGLERASKTLRNITGLHVLEHKASVDGGKIAEYRVTMEVTFILEA
jgi:flavin-binding protein dodecin